MNVSPFAKELYKLIRNKVKKLDDIQRIEERISQKANLTEEQEEKYQNKESYMQSVLSTIEVFEIYKATELPALL